VLDRRGWGTELSLAPGLRYGFETKSFGEFEVGVAVPIGLTRDSPDWGILVRFQWEIGH
jgi:hypothetical protein